MRLSVVLFIAVIVCSGAVSCGTQRHLEVRQESGASFSGTVSDSSELSVEVREMVEKMMAETIERLVVQDMTVEREVYSAPDSAGRQHITERTHTTVNTSMKERGGQAVSESTSRTEVKDSTGISASGTSSVHVSFTDTEEKTGLNWWQKALIWAGAAGIASLLIRLALKFFRT